MSAAASSKHFRAALRGPPVSALRCRRSSPNGLTALRPSPLPLSVSWRALLQDIELMPQHQDFSFEPPLRLEADAHHADGKNGNCDHQPQSCSDSVAAATPLMEFSEATDRDCLDHVVVFGERHLRHVLGSYQRYYNDARTHLSLNNDAPASRAVQAVGRIVADPHLGGLHHQYVRV
jgi:hypothetical protein